MVKPNFGKYEAVHVPTQEEWDYVTEKLGYKWSNGSSTLSKYKLETCIRLEGNRFGRRNNYTLIMSFQEFKQLYEQVIEIY